MKETQNIKIKICMLGQFGVGKTSLINRYVYDHFDDKYLSTIGLKVSQKLLPPIRKNKHLELIQYSLLIWDIASMNKFDRMAKNYFSGASGALAISDLTRPDSLDELRKLSRQFLSVNSEAKIIIIGNKSDIIERSDLPNTDYEKIAREFCTEVMYTSAKTGSNVEEAFLKLVHIL